jgi:hypothetical protein
MDERGQHGLIRLDLVGFGGICTVVKVEEA